MFFFLFLNFFYRFSISLFCIWRWWIVFFLWNSVFTEKHGVRSWILFTIWSLHLGNPSSIFSFSIISTNIHLWTPKKKIFKDKVLEVGQNGMILTCPGMFAGELIVTMDKGDHSSVFVAIKSTNTELDFFKKIFRSLVNKNFPQCIFQTYFTSLLLFCFRLFYISFILSKTICVKK